MNQVGGQKGRTESSHRKGTGGRVRRAELGRTDAQLTDLGCPDCTGVLAVTEIGKKGFLRFRCQVGHAFSGDDLVLAKESELEASLWSTVELFEEVALLHRALASRARVLSRDALASAYERRIRRSRALVRQVRAVIKMDRPAQIAGKRGD